MAVSAVTEKKNELHVEEVAHKGLTWINIEKPTSRDMEHLLERYPFHQLDVDDCLSRIQRPKIDEYDDYVFIVLHFPRFHKQARVMAPSQVALFVGESYVVSVHSGELKPLAKLFNDCQLNESAREEYMTRSSGYLLYSIIDRLVDYCFPILNKINENMEGIEDRVFSEATPGTVRETLVIRRDIISFRRIIRPQIPVLDSLEEKRWPFLKEDLDIYFGNIGDHLDKLWDTLEDYREVVDTLTDTSNWLTSHRIQEIMRVLTILAAAFAPLAVVSGIYGMNVPLPLGGSQLGFPILMGIMILIFALLMLFFHHRRWI